MIDAILSFLSTPEFAFAMLDRIITFFPVVMFGWVMAGFFAAPDYNGRRPNQARRLVISIVAVAIWLYIA